MQTLTTGEPRDLSLRTTFFRSVTLVTSASAVILAGGEGIWFPAALTPLFAIVGWILVDQYRLLRIPVLAGNLFGMVALIIAAREFSGGTMERKLLSGAHLIVYLTWIVLLLPKANRQYWWLIALSVLKLAIAGLLSGGVGFGISLLGMMLLMLWTMSVFSLFRVQDEYQELRKRNAGAGTLPHRTLVHASEAAGQTSAGVGSGLFSREFFARFLGLRSFSQNSIPRPANGTSGDDHLRPRAAVSESRNGQDPIVFVRNGLQRDPAEAWVGWRFRGMVTGSYAVSVVLAIIVFAAFPRFWVPGGRLLSDLSNATGGFRNRTGFSESMSLGNIGQLMQNSERVLAFSIRNLRTGRPVTAEAFSQAMQMDEIRFRGNVFSEYRDGHWSSGMENEAALRFGDFIELPSDFRLELTQDPPLSNFCFAPYPVSRVRVGNNQRVLQLEARGSLIWMSGSDFQYSQRAYSVDCPDLSVNPELTFEYWCDLDDVPEQERELFQERRSRFVFGFFLMDGFNGPPYRWSGGTLIPERRTWDKSRDVRYVVPKLHQLANQICSEDGVLVPPAERVERILRWLSPQNGFRYSLAQNRQDRNLDPVEDFILNTKSGHCEYFASACTLMLHAVQVPSRLVNGYYGCEINNLTGKYEVRQYHAHAWVEVFLDDRWKTLEPTPGDDRQRDLQSTSSSGLISNFQSALSDLWSGGVQRMSAERQQEFFAPVISTSRTFIESIRQRGIQQSLRQMISQFINSPSSWFSAEGGIITFMMLLIGAGVIRFHLPSKMLTLLRWMIAPFRAQQRAARSVVRFYEGFCTLCERHGLFIPPANSARENAELALAQFGSRLTSPQLKSLPIRVADAFNQVRFGKLLLSDEQSLAIRRDLGAFADALQSRSKN